MHVWFDARYFARTTKATQEITQANRVNVRLVVFDAHIHSNTLPHPLNPVYIYADMVIGACRNSCARKILRYKLDSKARTFFFSSLTFYFERARNWY